MNGEKSVRLDSFISKKYPNYSRGLIQKLIKNGHVKVDGSLQLKPSFAVNETEKIDIDEKNLNPSGENLNIEIIYEDDNVVVVNKPLGVLVHSKGAYNPEVTVLDWLKKRPEYSFPADSERGGVVHRLDRATSGVMICAKNKETLGYLQKQFQNRKTKKVYIALVTGTVTPEHALLDLPIARNPKKPQIFRVNKSGKNAQTEYRVMSSSQKYTTLELKPITGRTHQLRVHLEYIKHPIVGDEMYNGQKSDRLYLHAKSLEITIPEGLRKVFEAKLPKEFNK